MSVSAQVADVLEKAAKIIEQRGRARTTAEDSAGRVCPIMALTLTDEPFRIYDEARERLRAFVDEPTVVDWNERVEDDAVVLTALRECAAAERAR